MVQSTFYYTANDRVDFRQLIKEFAQEFKIRIEMKQVGFRQKRLVFREELVLEENCVVLLG